MQLQYLKINCSEKQTKLLTTFSRSVIIQLLKQFEHVADLVLLTLEYAEIKEYIETIYIAQGCIPTHIEKPLTRKEIIHRTFLVYETVEEVYFYAEKTYGTSYIQCHFYIDMNILQAKIRRLLQELETTNYISYYEPCCDDSNSIICINTDDETFIFHRFMDTCSDFELELIPYYPEEFSED